MIVVSGGAGFVGSHVAEFYAHRGERVLVVDDRSRADLLGVEQAQLDNWEWVKRLPNVEAVEASILDADLLPDLVAGARAVVHAGAQTAVTVSLIDPRTDFLVNALGTMNLLEAVRTAAPRAALVFCSTNKVYGENVNALPVRRERMRYAFEGEWQAGVPETLSIDQCEHSPYGVSKTTGDLYVQEYGRLYGLRTAVLRMSCIYGPRQWGVSDQGWLAWFARAALSGLPLTIYGDGRQTRDVLYVSDLVAAIDAALETELHGEVFNIGGGPDLGCSLLEALEWLERLTGRRPSVRYEDWRPCDQRIYVSDTRKAQRSLGWQPKVGLEFGIGSLLEWLRTSGSQVRERVT